MSSPAPVYPYSIAASPIDLTTLEAVTDYLAQNEGAIISPDAATEDNLKIQALITGLSQSWLTKTGRSSLNSVGSFNEVYDGNGSFRLFLDNWPILIIISVQVFPYTLPLSTSLGQFGVFIERSQKSIAIRPGGLGTLTSPGYGPQATCFLQGIGNMQVQYTGGYNGIPNDIFEAVTWQVAQAYKKRDSINIESMSMGGGAGSTSFVKWDWTPEIKATLRDYTKIYVG